jgi:hypothetical protein
VAENEGAPDPNAAPWALPEPPVAGSRPAWIPPGSRPHDPAYAPPGPPPLQGWPPPPGWGQPGRRKPMPRWAKVVIGVWVVFAVLGLVFQIVNLLWLRNL